MEDEPDRVCAFCAHRAGDTCAHPSLRWVDFWTGPQRPPCVEAYATCRGTFFAPQRGARPDRFRRLPGGWWVAPATALSALLWVAAAGLLVALGVW